MEEKERDGHTNEGDVRQPVREQQMSTMFLLLLLLLLPINIRLHDGWLRSLRRYFFPESEWPKIKKYIPDENVYSAARWLISHLSQQEARRP